MSRIDDWQIGDPVKRLIHRLNEVGSRNTPETTEVLERFMKATEKCALEVEMAAQQWVIDTSQANERMARQTLDEHQREYAERFPE